MTDDARPNLHLVKLDRATQMLSECRTIPEALQIGSLASAAAMYAREARLGVEAINHATEIKLRAERLAGQIAKELGRKQGERNDLATSSDTPTKSEYRQTLEETGVTRQEANRWQKLAEIPEPEFDGRIAKLKEKNEKITTSAVMAITSALDHDGDLWRTPAEWVERVRAVLGGIDLDPASTVEANKTVKAKAFFTESDDGLKKSWSGSVFLNPPYSMPLIEQFSDKALLEWAACRITGAVILVNSATDTAWYQRLLVNSAAAFLTRGRIGFIGPSGKPSNQNRCGQTFFFLMDASDKTICRIKDQFAQPDGVLVRSI